jgi:hypothetical protein
MGKTRQPLNSNICSDLVGKNFCVSNFIFTNTIIFLLISFSVAQPCKSEQARHENATRNTFLDNQET